MITRISPIGITHIITLVLAYAGGESGSDNCTITVLAQPKDAAKHEPLRVQFAGPCTELDEKLPDLLTQMTAKVAGLNADLAALDQQIADTKTAHAARLEAEKKKATPAPAAAKSTAKSKAKPAKAKDAKDDDEPAPGVTDDDPAEPEAAAPIVVAEPKPAWKDKAPAPSALVPAPGSELNEMFPDL